MKFHQQPLRLKTLKNPYQTLRYTNSKRVFSYAHQLSCVLEEDGQEILVVGPGPGMVVSMLRLMNFHVTTLDIDPDVNADVVAHVLEMPFSKNSFDIVLCCQVLEHLPFHDFDKALRLFKEVSRKAAIISLPDASRHIDLILNLPWFGKIKKSFDYPPGKKHSWAHMKDVGHFWEIGYADINLNKVKNIMTGAGWKIDRTWRVPELPWHRFFLLHHK